MGIKNFLDKNGLAHLKLLLENLFQKREHKTGSESEYKVLSDNNLTDELVKKIEAAGTSQFDGQFDSLKGIPTLDGHELKGTLTSEILGLAKSTDIPTDYVSNSTLEEKGYQTASDVELAIEGKGYQTESQVTTAINKAVANINKKQTVTSTEEMTDENVIYLMANKGAGNNIYDEYIVVNGKPEKIGTTEVDLTGYLREEDLSELTNDEIDAIFNS